MKPPKTLPTQKELFNLFDYNKETGELTSKTDAATVYRDNTHRYIKVLLNGQHYLAHRIIWKMITGNDPVNVIDHINRVRDDNRIDNLQDITQLVENVIKDIKKGSGVYPYKGQSPKKWMARPRIDGVLTYLGLYYTEAEALQAVTNHITGAASV